MSKLQKLLDKQAELDERNTRKTMIDRIGGIDDKTRLANKI